MQVHAERRPPLRARLPAAREAVRRRQRLGQAQQLVDGHRHRARTCSSPGDTPARERCSSCSSARRSSRPSTSTRRCCARRSPTSARTTASAPTRRRRRSSRSSSAPSSRRPSTRSRPARADATRRACLGLGTAGAAAAAAARRRPQPHLAVRLHRQQVRVPRAGLEHVARLRQHGAQHDRRRGDRRAGRAARGSSRAKGRRVDDAVLEVVKEVWKKPTSASSSAATTTPTSGTRRPRSAGSRTCARRRTRCRGWSRSRRSRLFERYNVLSERELESRYEVFVEQYATKLNIEAETAASIARTMILPAAVRHLAELKAGGLDALVDRGRAADRRARQERSKALEKANATAPGPTEASSTPKYMRDKVIPAMDGVRDGRPTASSASSPTTSGRCRSTRRCCSSSSVRRDKQTVRRPRQSGAFALPRRPIAPPECGSLFLRRSARLRTPEVPYRDGAGRGEPTL